MRRDEIRSIIKEHGAYNFGVMVESVLKGYKLPNGAVVKKNPTDFNFKTLWEACVGDIGDTLDNAAWRSGLSRMYSEAGGALDITGFPAASEKILSSQIIAGYDSVPMIGDQLVPNVNRPTSLREVIPGATTLDSPKPILAGEEYPTVGFGEKFVTFEEAVYQKKEGYEIQVTEEVVRFDRTNFLLDRARTLGRTISIERERRTIRAIMGLGDDVSTTQQKVYFPAGVDTPLYAATTSNLRTDSSALIGSNSKLADYTDLQEVLTVHATLIKDDRISGNTRPIIWTPRVLLVPISLQLVAGNIFSSQGQIYVTNTGSAPEIRNIAPSPISAMFNNGLPMSYSSPYVDEVSTTHWFLYDPETFVRIEVFPFQTFQSPTGYGWNRDIIFAMRAREWSRVVAKDYRQTIKSNGA